MWKRQNAKIKKTANHEHNPFVSLLQLDNMKIMIDCDYHISFYRFLYCYTHININNIALLSQTDPQTCTYHITAAVSKCSLCDNCVCSVIFVLLQLMFKKKMEQYHWYKTLADIASLCNHPHVLLNYILQCVSGNRLYMYTLNSKFVFFF